MAHCSAGIVASLTEEPKIISVLPDDAKANRYSERLTGALSDIARIGSVQAGYFHDCGNLSQTDIDTVLKTFKEHYNNYNDGLPGCSIGGVLPADNEIICNIQIITNNILTPGESKSLLSSNTCNSIYDYLY